jgi:hypothetical protein
MAPYTVGALLRRSYIYQREQGATPQEATAYIEHEYGYVSPQDVTNAQHAGEVALGTAGRANRQRLGDELQYAAYAGVTMPAQVQAKVLIAYRLPNGTVVYNSQWWTVPNTTTRQDIRDRAAQYVADQSYGAGAAKLVSSDYEAVV